MLAEERVTSACRRSLTVRVPARQCVLACVRWPRMLHDPSKDVLQSILQAWLLPGGFQGVRYNGHLYSLLVMTFLGYVMPCHCPPFTVMNVIRNMNPGVLSSRSQHVWKDGGHQCIACCELFVYAQTCSAFHLHTLFIYIVLLHYKFSLWILTCLVTILKKIIAIKFRPALFEICNDMSSHLCMSC